MASIDDLTGWALAWLKAKKKKPLMLQRTAYFVPGLTDEDAGCWTGKNSIAEWGPKVFANWDTHARIVTFKYPYPSPMRSFFDFADDLRAEIAMAYPDNGLAVGEYDLVSHSMGALDALAALFDDAYAARTNPPIKRIANAFNFVSFDAPYGGVPNAEARKALTTPDRAEQCDCLMVNSPELGIISGLRKRVPDRISRVTCYGADSTFQVEVQQPDMYPQNGPWKFERKRVGYRYFRIPGSSHSGGLGCTKSVIAIANLFETLGTSKAKPAATLKAPSQ